MATLILEKDIPATTFVSSLSPMPQKWYRQLTYILNTDELNKGVLITFNTTEGSKIVRTTIVAVIENYVKISDGVIIPLNCVTAITAQDGILPAEDRSNIFEVVLFFIFIILLSIVLLFFILHEGDTMKIGSRHISW